MVTIAHSLTEVFHKQDYLQLLSEGALNTIFFQDWWLDATAGVGNWDAIVIKEKGQIVAALPFSYSVDKWQCRIGQPKLTQFLGPWIRAYAGGERGAVSREKRLLQGLANALSEDCHYLQNWRRGFVNWLPFYWRGFSQSTYYTYVIPELTDLDKVWSGFHANIRTDIRKAQHRFGLKVVDRGDFDDFARLNGMVFQRQQKNQPYDLNYIRHLDRACAEHGARKIFVAVDAQGRQHAGVYIVWDSECAYYLMGGGDPELRNSGATSLCMWEAIKFSSTVTKQFDFEGSMLEPVERFFRAFGAEQTPYFKISRKSSKLAPIWLRAALRLRGWASKRC